MNTPKGLGRTLTAAAFVLGVGCAESRSEKPEPSMESLRAFIAAKRGKIVECSNLQREFRSRIDASLTLYATDSPDKCQRLYAALADARKTSEELDNKCTGFADRDNDGHDYGWGEKTSRYSYSWLKDDKCYFDDKCPGTLDPRIHKRCAAEDEDAFLYGAGGCGDVYGDE